MSEVDARLAYRILLGLAILGLVGAGVLAPT
jgi:hypothetical protein